MVCPLRNPSLFTLKFDSLSQFYFLKQLKTWLFAIILLFKTIKSFSVKSEALRRGQTILYTE